MSQTETNKMPLEGIDAINLWKSGKAEWNSWVTKNPDTPISFKGIDFSAYIPPEVSICFEDFHFPGAPICFDDVQFGIGRVSFANAQFGDGNVSFEYAQFGDGNVSFRGTQFGVGDISFAYAHFGKGRVFFDDAQFGKGNVSFYGTKFGTGHLFFSGTQFDDGHVIFAYAQFDNYLVSFHGTQFGEGAVSFEHAKFNTTRSVSFGDVQFGRGDVSFDKAQFGGEDVSFRGSQFDDGAVSFDKAQFGGGDVSFLNTQFGDVDLVFTRMYVKSSFRFDAEHIQSCSSFSFRGSQFDDNLILHNINVECVIDLRNTKLSRPIDLDNVKTNFITERRFGLFHRAKSPEDSTCYRRLKKLAKEADDHDSALQFFAQEKRAGYWHDVKGAELLFYYLYDLLSNYGRSISRPLVGLFATWSGFSYLYWENRTEYNAPESAAGLLSMGHSIPFYLGSRDIIGRSLEALYGSNIPEWIHVTAAGQSVISGIFLFLIALALRNLSRT